VSVAVIRRPPSVHRRSTCIVAHVTLRVDNRPVRQGRPMSDQRTALVLGGGIPGIAWEIGVVAGLAEPGVDLVAAVGASCAVPGVYRR
jgi:predicted acylesterase/phospholipase RssA